MAFEYGEQSGGLPVGGLYDAFLGAVAARSEDIHNNRVRLPSGQITAVEKLGAEIKKHADELGQELQRQQLLADMKPELALKAQLGVVQGECGAADTSSTFTQLRIV